MDLFCLFSDNFIDFVHCIVNHAESLCVPENRNSAHAAFLIEGIFGRYLNAAFSIQVWVRLTLEVEFFQSLEMSHRLSVSMWTFILEYP